MLSLVLAARLTFVSGNGWSVIFIPARAERSEFSSWEKTLFSLKQEVHFIISLPLVFSPSRTLDDVLTKAGFGANYTKY